MSTRSPAPCNCNRNLAGLLYLPMTIPKTTKGLLDSPHGRLAADVLAALEVSVITGLSEHEADRRCIAKLIGVLCGRVVNAHYLPLRPRAFSAATDIGLK